MGQRILMTRQLHSADRPGCLFSVRESKIGDSGAVDVVLFSLLAAGDIVDSVSGILPDAVGSWLIAAVDY